MTCLYVIIIVSVIFNGPLIIEQCLPTMKDERTFKRTKNRPLFAFELKGNFISF